MRFIEVSHGSKEHSACVQLRREVLRWPLGLDFTEAELCAESADIHLGAFLGDRCVGCLVLSRSQPRVIKMRQVAVAPELQGTGIGRQLVGWAESRARELGGAAMVLHAREAAVPFYLHLGYQVEGEIFEEVGIEHRVMTKDLQSA